jgi:hypothetical protein
MHRAEPPASAVPHRLEAVALAQLQVRGGDAIARAERDDEVRAHGRAVTVERDDAVRDDVLRPRVLVVAACLRDEGVAAARRAPRRLDRCVGGEDRVRVVPALFVEPEPELADEVDDRRAIVKGRCLCPRRSP